MKKLAFVLVCVLALATMGFGQSVASDVNKTATAQGTKTAATKTAHGTKRVAHKTAHSTKRGVKKVAHKTKEGAKKTEGAVQ